MRFPTPTLLVAATVATTLAAGYSGAAFADQPPLTADQKRENTRLSDARRAARTQRRAAVWSAYAEKCEAAFEEGELMPEKDLRITGELVIDDDLLEMTSEAISERYGL
ncbi:hypothetical protein, partial [Ruegeria sp. EL01]|uniref:hypothetical protein n=1 Tax=Ruegeria sp. EL01 TaxID=2107578 RepID=UPI0013C3EC1A